MSSDRNVPAATRHGRRSGAAKSVADLNPFDRHLAPGTHLLLDDDSAVIVPAPMWSAVNGARPGVAIPVPPSRRRSRMTVGMRGPRQDPTLPIRTRDDGRFASNRWARWPGMKKPRRVGPGGAKVSSCREGGHHPSDLALLRGWLEHRRPGSLVTDRRCLLRNPHPLAP